MTSYFIIHKSSRHLIVVKKFSFIDQCKSKGLNSSSGREFNRITALSSSSIFISTLTRSVEASCSYSCVRLRRFPFSSENDKASSSTATVIRCSLSNTFSLGFPQLSRRYFMQHMILDVFSQARTDQTTRRSVHLVLIFLSSSLALFSPTVKCFRGLMSSMHPSPHIST